MKQFLSLIWCGLLMTSVTATQDYEDEITLELTASEVVETVEESTAIPTPAVDDLAQLRVDLAEQTIQIKEILTTLCQAIASSTLSNKDSLCEQFSVLRTLIEQFCSAVQTMSPEELAGLVHAHHILLDQLQHQLATGDLCDLNNFDPAAFSLLQQRAPSLQGDALQEEVLQLQRKVAVVWGLVTPLVILVHEQEQMPGLLDNVLKKLEENQNAAMLAGLVMSASYLPKLEKERFGTTAAYIVIGGALHHYGAKFAENFFSTKKMPSDASAKLSKERVLFNKDQEDGADDLGRMLTNILGSNARLVLGLKPDDKPSKLTEVCVANAYDFYRSMKTVVSAFNSDWQLLSKQTTAKTLFAMTNIFNGFVHAYFNAKMGKIVKVGDVDFFEGVKTIVGRGMRNKLQRVIFDEDGTFAQGLASCAGLTLKNNDEQLGENDVYYNERLNKSFGDLGFILSSVYFALPQNA